MLPQDTNTDTLPGDDADGASGQPADVTPANPGDEVAHPRRIRSFVRRAGRTSTGQQRAIDDLGPKFIVPYQAEPLDWAATFGREAPSILEIGFGMGETTAHIAKLRPQDNFLGCEVHEPGVGALLKLIGENDLQNVRIMNHDAVEVIAHMLTEQSLDGVHIFFPDPWPKKRHMKRRLLTPEFLNLIYPKLKKGAFIHVATDWVPYAEFVMKSFAQVPEYVGGEVERPRSEEHTSELQSH